FYKDLIRNCATCQLCLCLARYCVDSRFKNFEVRLQSGLNNITKDKNYVDNALTFLLHHWREILCAENLVKLRTFRAAVFLDENPREASACASPWHTKKFKSKGSAKRTPSPVKATLVDIESKNTNSDDTPLDKTTEKDRLLSPKEGEADNVGSKIESAVVRRASKVAYFKRKDSGLSSGSSDNVAKSAVSGGNVSARSTGAPEQKEDLYTWMARQQEIERNKTKKDSLEKASQKNTDFAFDNRELNPYNLSLQTFFDVFYCHESLMKRGELINILFALGDQ
uniref:Uncharacterized protein n=1 Tax=Romanomermis culicivorax TaxID=13658 RepID=A0A915K757_ROMCU